MSSTESLSYLSDQDRATAYALILEGCSHLYSKGKIQEDKVLNTLNVLIPLTQKDPLFLAHFASWIIKQKVSAENKDISMLAIYANALSSANGQPFSPGSKYLRPNLRYVSVAALQTLDPKLASRVLEIANDFKFGVSNYLNPATHFPQILRTAFRKYLKYRENNLPIVEGIKKSGLGNIFKKMYRVLHSNPTDEVASILRWSQGDRKIVFKKSQFDFAGLSDLEIANKIREKKLPVLGVLGALPHEMTPVIAVALLEQATGNQAVILRKTFEDAGILKDPEVFKLYEEKIKTAKTALDRVEALTQQASEEVKKLLKDTRAEKRKEQMGAIGKVALLLDRSGSMDSVFEIATKAGATLGEIIPNPKENFFWGTYNERGEVLDLPEEFVEDAFAAILFGQKASGSTDCGVLYPPARLFGAEIDVHISDGEHNVGDLGVKIRKFHEDNPTILKPKACLIVLVKGNNDTFMNNTLKEGYEANQIPVAIIKPEVLQESALVAQTIRSAFLGPVAMIDEIMGTELLTLPNWYFAL